MTMPTDLRDLQRTIGYRFKDPKALQKALTHMSYVNEVSLGKHMSNQRLEYLGDAVLQLAVAEIIFQRLPEADEGLMSNLRSKLVCTASLARIAKGLGLGRYLLLGKGADKDGERENPTVLEDAFEAMLGALYLDGGWRRASATVRRLFEVSVLNTIEGYRSPQNVWDHKTALQIHLQREGPATITYRLAREEGPPHNRLFFMDVYYEGTLLGSGSGATKKEAEQNAAKYALEGLHVLKEG
jgi:ribonuclease-3